jgi:hypothetical protein
VIPLPEGHVMVLLAAVPAPVPTGSVKDSVTDADPLLTPSAWATAVINIDWLGMVPGAM